MVQNKKINLNTSYVKVQSNLEWVTHKENIKFKYILC